MGRHVLHFGGKEGERGPGARTKMELQVPHFQRVTAAVLGEAAPEISDRVDKLVCDIQKKLYIWRVRNALIGGPRGGERKTRRTSSTSGSILMFGSMLRTRSWIDRRMLASPGVALRLDGASSVAHVSSLGFFNADGVPNFRIAQKKKKRERERERERYIRYPDSAPAPSSLAREQT